MIVVDIETSGLDIRKNGIWQIGALDMETGKTFLEEARIDDEDEIMEEALLVTGKTEEEMRDKKKQTQKKLIINFLNWLKKFKEKIIAGDNVGFDINFIQTKCINYNIQKEFLDIMGYRGIDLPTLAQLRYKEKTGKFKLKDGLNDMSLRNILEMCGIKDERIQLEKGKVVQKGKAHNSLEDAKLEAECFRRLLKELEGKK